MLSAEDLQRLLQVVDQDNTRWLTLEGSYRWSEELPPHLDEPFNPRGLLLVDVTSYLVPKSRFAEFVAWARRQDWLRRRMPEGPELSQVFLGEWPWHPSASIYVDTQESIEPASGEEDPMPAGAIPTWAIYTSAADGSLADGVSAALPGDELVRRQGLQWREGSSSFEGPSSEVATQDPSMHSRGSGALLHDEGSLRRLLDKEALSLVWTISGEKNMSGDHPRPDRILMMSGMAALESGSDAPEVELRTALGP